MQLFVANMPKKIEIGVEEVIPRLEVLVWHFVVALRI
jgi:hypothetical protein